MKTFPARHCFNWGFHDATADKMKGRNRASIPQGELFCLPDFDPVYCAGYFAGQNELLIAGRPESSECAWILYQVNKMAAQAMEATA